MTTSDEKVCPRCAETVRAAAKVCRFCGHEFEAQALKPLKVSLGEPAEKKKAAGGCAKFVGAVIVLIFLAAIVGSILGDNTSSNSASSGSNTSLAAKTCKNDWMVCADNGDLVNNWSDWTKVQVGCKMAAEDAAKYGTPKWPWIAFGSYLKGDNYISTGIATAIENDAQFQNGFGAMAHSEVICRYDLRADKVLDVNVVPR